MLPVIHTLKAEVPGIQITWVIGKVEYKLLGHLPDVEFIIFDKTKGLKAYLDIWQALKGRRFDALLLMQVALRANLLGWIIRADRKIGYDRLRAKDFHGLFITEQIAPTPAQHVADSFLSFLETLGIHEKRYRWDLPKVLGAEQLTLNHIEPEQPVMIISPCSSHERRNWHVNGYAAVADYAVEHYGMQVIICGGPSPTEKQMAQEIIRACRHSKPVNLVGQDTFVEFLELLARATVLVTPDSGPMHMAAITDTPVIGLHAASNPLRSGPYKSLEWCVNQYDQASRKYLGKPSDQIRWGTKIEKQGVMNLVEISQVTGKLDALMKKLKE